MNSPAYQSLRTHLADPFVFGAACGIVSSLGYTAANICLRTVSHCDPYWVSCIKSVPTILLCAPWFIVLASQGRRILPSPKGLAALLLSGLAAQLFGNVMFQWSLGVLGIALTVPLVLGTMIAGGASLGRLVLGEKVTPRSLLSMVLLISAIAVLSLGAGDAYRSVTGATASSQSWLILAAGIAGSMISGLAYAQLGVVIRFGMKGTTPLSTTVVATSVSGLVSLGIISVFRIGVDGMLETEFVDGGLMIMAGLCNALAFVALTKALQLAPVVFVNAVNATQATLGMLAGVFLFHEAASPALLLGVGLTIIGLLLTERRKSPAKPLETADPGANLPGDPDSRLPLPVAADAVSQI
ncbi:DMT family transporter [Lignipirellula cremea]|uniref:DMT family transporter n=1 Tax=Lignipirellula cremea TaxID=2528010 RepID=UPI0018D260AF|nr:DMT family transporter [Lignipirellula cremea]